MNTRTITGTITGGYTLSSSYSALTLTGTGSITGAAGNSGGAGGAGLVSGYGAYLDIQGAISGGAGGYSPSDGGSGGSGVTLSGGSVTNSGSILGGAGGVGHGSGGDGGTGVVLSGGGAVANGGVISGGEGGFGIDSGGRGGTGVVLSGGGTVVNDGAISGGEGLTGNPSFGGSGGTGVYLSSGGTVTNFGSIAAGASGGANNSAALGVLLETGGTVINGSKTNSTASISGAFGIYSFYYGATTVINYGSIQGTSGAAIVFQYSADRLVVEGGSTVVGAVEGGGGALELAAGTGTITGLGIQFTGFGSYQLDAGGAWTLTGANSLRAGENVGVAGTLTIAGTVTSRGTIDGLAGSRVFLKGADMIGGTLESALNVAVVGTGNTLDGTAGTLINETTILVANKAALTLEGDIDNTKALRLGATTHTSQLIIGAAGATLGGGGKVILSGNQLNIITGVTAGATLTNADNRIMGSGQIGAGTLTLVNQAGGVIDQTGSVGLTIDTGANTIANAGVIEATGSGGMTIAGALANTGKLEALGGNLTVEGAVSGGGSAVIHAGTLTFAAAFGENVLFNAGATGELVLAQSQGYTGKIIGFSKTGATTLDLRDISDGANTRATFRHGVLTVTDGTETAKISLAGNFAGSTFSVSDDGHGGVLIVDPPRPGAFVSAMAGLGAQGGSTVAASTPVPPTMPTLLSRG